MNEIIKAMKERRSIRKFKSDIVSKKDYDTTVLKDGDTLEVVSFVGGG